MKQTENRSCTRKYLVISRQICRWILLLWIVGLPLLGHAQQTQTPQTFDVIILKNGKLIYGLVKEVGLTNIRYQRTDIPDGPIYVIRRDQVYAISYRNQVEDVLSPVDSTIFGHPPIEQPQNIDTSHLIMPVTKPTTGWWRQGIISAGLGFLRGYTAVSQANSYQSSNTFPFVLLGYDFQYAPTLRLGIQMGIGSHRFSRSQYDDYDSTFNQTSLKENIFSLHVYGMYQWVGASNSQIIHPYVLGGIGFVNAHIKSSQQIQFLGKPNQQLQIHSGTRAINISLLARAGIRAMISDQIEGFADAGLGNSILRIGICYRLY